MIRRPPRSTLDRSSAASDVYKTQSLYNSKHLSFETSSFAFSTINHAFFFTFNRLHHLFIPPLTVRILTSYFSTPTYFFCTANNCFQIYLVSACSHSTDLLASVLTYLSLLLCSLNFSLLILPSSLRITFLSIQVPTNLILHRTT